MAVSVAPLLRFLEDAELATRAANGDGHAFAELYDRHEQRVYGFCLRLLGNPHDAADATQDAFVRVLARLPALRGREVHFIAYALTCARNACYDMIRSRQRVQPVDGEPQPLLAEPGHVSEDPERAALLASARADVQAANARLPTRQREVLSLREIELLSYDEIGEIMDLNRNAVAQLISRARIRLRELLRGDALASVRLGSPDCERALPLLAATQDGEAAEPGELEWVHRHLLACETCRVRREAMEEAGASYRALAAIVPLVWLRHAAIARAADYVGADWSEIAGPPPLRLVEPATPRPATGSRDAAARRFRPGAGRGLLAILLALVASIALVARVAPDPTGASRAAPSLAPVITSGRLTAPPRLDRRSRTPRTRTLTPVSQTSTRVTVNSPGAPAGPTTVRSPLAPGVGTPATPATGQPPLTSAAPRRRDRRSASRLAPMLAAPPSPAPAPPPPPPTVKTTSTQTAAPPPPTTPAAAPGGGGAGGHPAVTSSGSSGSAGGSGTPAGGSPGNGGSTSPGSAGGSGTPAGGSPGNGGGSGTPGVAGGSGSSGGGSTAPAGGSTSPGSGSGGFTPFGGPRPGGGSTPPSGFLRP